MLRDRRAPVVAQAEVLGEREVEHEAAAVAVLGDVADAGVELAADVGVRDVGAVDADRAGQRAAQAGERLDELALAVVVDARDADDLARAHLQREPADRGQAAIVLDLELLDLEQRRARLGALLGDPEEHVAADHQAREALLRRALGRHRLDLLAAPQHAHAVGDLEHLAELVRDEDDRLALRRAACAGS